MLIHNTIHKVNPQNQEMINRLREIVFANFDTSYLRTWLEPS